MLTFYIRCSRCNWISNRSPEIRQIIRNRNDLTVCGKCILFDFQEEGRKLMARWEDERLPLLVGL